eukprot:gene5609-4029_t
MAIGKNKRLNKGGKRGKRGKIVEAMSRKEWYDVVAPANFANRQFAKSICNKTQGIKIAADFLRGRVFEANLADVKSTTTPEDALRKVRFAVQEVQGRNLLTQFHSMSMTTDNLASLLRKWCTTMETCVEARTADGYVMRVFVIAFTKKQKNQLSRNCYAKQRLVRWVRARITKLVVRQLEKASISEAVSLLTRDVIANRLIKRCSPIVPIRDLRIRKVKVVRTPKYDAQALLNAHGEIPASIEADAREVEGEVVEETAGAAATAAQRCEVTVSFDLPKVGVQLEEVLDAPPPPRSPSPLTKCPMPLPYHCCCLFFSYYSLFFFFFSVVRCHHRLRFLPSAESSAPKLSLRSARHQRSLPPRSLCAEARLPSTAADKAAKTIAVAPPFLQTASKHFFIPLLLPMTEESDRVTAGLNDYAQLRLRDQRPGNGEYQLPPAFGPKSDSLKKSILRKYDVNNQFRNPVGPGHYNLPEITGRSRATQFGPALEKDERGNPLVPPVPQDPPKEPPGEVRDLAKQYSLALHPDTPQYSLYGKIAEKEKEKTVGPGTYTIPSAFDRRTWGVPEGAHLGARTDMEHDRGIPGPGTYNVKRFGDVLPQPKEYIEMPKRKLDLHNIPGPGSYEDPTTIAYRLTSKPKLWQRCTFGGRCDPRRRKVGPGPAGYNIGGLNHFIERKRRHAPTFKRPSGFPRKVQTKPYPKDHPEIVLPSDFDYDYKKGKSMIPRWHDKELRKEGPEVVISPDAPYKLPKGGRFAFAPFDPYAALQNTEKEASALGNKYDPNYSIVEKRQPAATINSPRALPGNPTSVPGPGYYNPDYKILYPPGNATIFYKGDFHDRGENPAAAGPGPGEHYNDATEYSRSIQGCTGHGKSFGIRYPARSTYQHCKPRDANTNVNCIYPDELTWQSPEIRPANVVCVSMYICEELRMRGEMTSVQQPSRASHLLVPSPLPSACKSEDNRTTTDKPRYDHVAYASKAYASILSFLFVFGCLLFSISTQIIIIIFCFAALHLQLLFLLLVPQRLMPPHSSALSRPQLWYLSVALLGLCLASFGPLRVSPCAAANAVLTGLVTDAQLTSCLPDDPTGCMKKKLVLTLTVPNTVEPNKDVLSYVNTATEGDTVMLFNPYKIIFSRSATAYRYLMTYIQEFNGNPFEKDIEGRGCLHYGDLCLTLSTISASQSGTVSLSMDHLFETTSALGGVAAQITTPGVPPAEPAYLGNKMLFIPSRPASDPIVQAGVSEYMILPDSMVTLDGTECNKVGVSFNAGEITNQCRFSTGDCLGNQLDTLRKEDAKRIAAGAKPLYMASGYGTVNVQDFDPAESGQSSPYLLLSASNPRRSQFTLSLNADDLKYVVSVDSGEIQSARFYAGSTVMNFKDAAVTAIIQNTGSQAATYIVSVENCPAGVLPFTSQRVSLTSSATSRLSFPPQYNKTLLQMPDISCDVVLYNGLHQKLEQKNVVWVLTDFSVPDVTPSPAPDTCEACSFINIPCNVQHECLWHLSGFIGLLFALVAVLIGGYLFQRHIAAVLRFLSSCCCCGTPTQSDDQSEEAAVPQPKNGEAEGAEERSTSAPGGNSDSPASRTHTYTAASHSPFDDTEEGWPAVPPLLQQGVSSSHVEPMRSPLAASLSLREEVHLSQRSSSVGGQCASPTDNLTAYTVLCRADGKTALYDKRVMHSLPFFFYFFFFRFKFRFFEAFPARKISIYNFSIFYTFSLTAAASGQAAHLLFSCGCSSPEHHFFSSFAACSSPTHPPLWRRCAHCSTLASLPYSLVSSNSKGPGGVFKGFLLSLFFFRGASIRLTLAQPLVCAVPIPNVVPYNTHESICFAFPLFLFLFLPRLMYHSTTTTTSTLRRARSVRHSHRLAWAALTLLLLACSCLRPAGGALVAQSQLQQCTNNGLEPLKCSKKLVIALSVDAELKPGVEVMNFIGGATQGSTSVTFDPIKMTVSRSAVSFQYPLTYVSDFNAQPYEENLKGSIGKLCQDGFNAEATCGLSYSTTTGEPIPYSQGYCCDCGVCSAAHMCSANARMAMACDIFGAYSVASCLRFGDSWYSGFSMGSASMEFTIDLTFTRNTTDGRQESSTLQLSPSHLDAADTNFGAYGQLIGTFHPDVEPQYMSDKFLFLPTVTSALYGEGAAEYMILSNTMVTLDGTECNKVGVSYFAFNSQGSRCELAPGSCLRNQLTELRAADAKRAAAGVPTKYLASSYGTLMGLTRSAENPGLTNLAFGTSAPPSTMITVTINADSLQYVVSVATGQITSARLNKDSMEADSRGALLLVDVENTGHIVSSFTFSADNCSAGVLPMPSRRLSIEPGEVVHLELEVRDQDDSDHEAHCDLLLLNALRETADTRRVSWSVTEVVKTHGAQGDTTQSSGPSVSGTIPDSCSSCSVINVVCSFRQRCYGRSFGFVTVAALAVAAAVALFLFRSRVVSLLRLLCCCLPCFRQKKRTASEECDAAPAPADPFAAPAWEDTRPRLHHRREVRVAVADPYLPTDPATSCRSQLAESLSLHASVGASGRLRQTLAPNGSQRTVEPESSPEVSQRHPASEAPAHPLLFFTYFFSKNTPFLLRCHSARTARSLAYGSYVSAAAQRNVGAWVSRASGQPYRFEQTISIFSLLYSFSLSAAASGQAAHLFSSCFFRGVCAVPIPNVVPYNTHESICFAFPLFLFLFLPRLMYHSTTTTTSTLRRARSVRHSHRLAWAALTLLLLACSCLRPAGGALVAQSQLQQCTNNGLEPLKCSKKLVIALSVDAELKPGVEVMNFIGGATQGSTSVTFDPIKMTVSRSAVSFQYPLTYVSDFNAQPYEENLKGSIGKLCQDGFNAEATCGLSYSTTTGEPIPYSQGYCCDCGVCSAAHMCSANARMAMACDIFGAYSVASCLRFGDSWYSGFSMGSASMEFTINLTFTRNTTDGRQESSTLQLSPSHLDAADTNFGAYGQLIGTFHPDVEPQYMSDKFLFLPTVTSALYGEGAAEYMILSNTMVTLDGTECNKVGVSYFAFNSQGSRCELAPGSCLRNQLAELRAADAKRAAAGVPTKYLASSYGTLMGLTRSAENPGLTNLAFGTSAPPSTMITVTINADSLQYVVSVATGQITSARLNKDSMEADSRGALLLVDVENTGHIVSSFTFSADNCSAGVLPMPSRRLSIEPGEVVHLELEVRDQDDSDHEAHCDLLLLNALRETADTRRVSWSVTEVVKTHGAQGDTTQSSGPSVSGTIPDSCSSCSVINVVCSFRQRCYGRSFGFVTVAALAVAAAVALFLFRSRVVSLLRLLCCCLPCFRQKKRTASEECDAAPAPADPFAAPAWEDTRPRLHHRREVRVAVADPYLPTDPATSCRSQLAESLSLHASVGASGRLRQTLAPNGSQRTVEPESSPEVSQRHPGCSYCQEFGVRLRLCVCVCALDLRLGFRCVGAYVSAAAQRNVGAWVSLAAGQPYCFEQVFGLGVRHSHRLAWAALTLLLLACSCLRPAGGALVAQSQLQQCTNNGLEPLKCSKKLVIALSVDAELKPGVEVMNFIGGATQGSTSVTFDPIKMTVSRSAVSFQYPLTYVSDFNAQPYEENLKGSIGKLCQDGFNAEATCGLSYSTTTGEPIPYSQGYCCDCGVCSAAHMCSANARMAMACDIFGAYSVASCLRFGDSWYSGFSMGSASMEFTINLTFTRNTTDGRQESSTLQLSPSHLDAADTNFGAYGQLIGTFHPDVEPQYMSDKFLFLPTVTSALYGEGAAEYMILSNTMVTLDGTECNKVGVSYFAFNSQGSRCELAPGSCLRNQLAELRAADAKRAAAGVPTKYLASSYGTLMGLTRSAENPGLTNLAFGTSAPPSTMITVTINADSLQYVVSVATGQITSARLNKDSMEADSRGALLLVDVENTGHIVSSFTFSADNCSAGVLPMPSRRLSIEPGEVVHLELEVRDQDDSDHEAHCDLLLLNALRETADTRRVSWSVTEVVKTHGAQGDTTQSSGPSVSGTIPDSCSSCSVINVVCSFRQRCYGRSFGFVTVAALAVAAAVALFLFRSRVVSLLRLLCCCLPCFRQKKRTASEECDAAPAPADPFAAPAWEDTRPRLHHRREVRVAVADPYLPTDPATSCRSQLAESLSLHASVGASGRLRQTLAPNGSQRTVEPESSPEVRLRTLFFSLRISFPKIHLFFYVAIVLVLPGVWRTAVISPSFFLFLFSLPGLLVFLNPLIYIYKCHQKRRSGTYVSAAAQRNVGAWVSLAAGQPYCFEHTISIFSLLYSFSLSAAASGQAAHLFSSCFFVCAVPIPNVVPYNTHESIFRLPPLPLPLPPSPDVSLHHHHHLHTAPSSSVRHSHRLAWAALTLLLLACSCLRPAGGALVAQSQLQQCTNNGLEPLKCSKKLVIALSVDAELKPGVEVMNFIGGATQGSTSVTFDPIKMTVSRSAVSFQYPLTYVSDFNAQPYEENLKGSIGKLCQDGFNAEATCGLSYSTTTGEPIPYSQGTAVTAAANARMAMACDIFGAYSVASCLRFGDSWYSGFSMGSASMEFTINLTFTRNTTDGRQESSTLQLSPSHLDAADTNFGAYGQLIGTFHPDVEPQYMSDKFLFLPTVTSALYGEGAAEYMILSNTMVTLDGTECNKVGVSYFAFNSQGSRCELAPGSCLRNQLAELRAADAKRAAAGVPTKYLASSYGTLMGLTRSAENPGLTNLAFGTSAPPSTMITVTINADSLQYVVSVATGQITSARLNKDSMEADSRGALLLVDVENTGHIVSSFTFSADNCSAGVLPMPSRRLSIEPGEVVHLELEVRDQDDSDHEAHCDLLLLNALRETADTRRVSWSVTEVVKTHGAQGDTTQSSGPSVSGTIPDSCSSCSVINVVCSFRQRCYGRSFGFVTVAALAVAAAVALFLFRSRVVSLLRLLCCCLPCFRQKKRTASEECDAAPAPADPFAAPAWEDTRPRLHHRREVRVAVADPYLPTDPATSCRSQLAESLSLHASVGASGRLRQTLAPNGSQRTVEPESSPEVSQRHPGCSYCQEFGVRLRLCVCVCALDLRLGFRCVGAYVSAAAQRNVGAWVSLAAGQPYCFEHVFGFAFPLFLFLFLPRLMYHSTTTTTSTLRRARSVRHSHRLAWAALTLLLLACSCLRPAGGALVAQSQLQQCTNNGLEPLKCSKKLVIALSVDAELKPGVEVMNFIGGATQGSTSVTFDPIKMTVSRSAVSFQYPLTYVSDFNAQPYEENLKGSIGKLCQDGFNAEATCGLSYSTTTGEPIPYSQGYCCDCGVCSAAHMCSANARMAMACDIFGAYSVASCLRFGDSWYSGFSMGSASMEFTINLTFTRNTTDGRQESSTLQLSPSHLDAADTNFGAYGQLIGTFHPDVEPQYMSDKFLFLPTVTSALYGEGAAEYMILSNTMVTLDGTECNKVGVSYFAFNSQGSRCELAPGSCLRNQLAELRAADAKRAAAGVPTKYLASSYGTLMGLTRSAENPGLTNLAFGTSAPPSTMITVTINADSLQYVVSVATGQITSARLNKDSMEADSRGALLLVDVENTGHIVSSFTFSADNCSAGVLPMPSRRLSIEPGEVVHLELEVRDQDDSDHEAHCDLLLLNALRETADTRRVSWSVTEVVKTHGAQGDTTQSSGPSVSGTIPDSCSSCSVINVVCSFRQRCYGRSFGFVTVAALAVAAAVALFLFRSRVVSLLRLLCCCLPCFRQKKRTASEECDAAPAPADPFAAPAWEDTRPRLHHRREVRVAVADPYLPTDPATSCRSQLAESLSLHASVGASGRLRQTLAPNGSQRTVEPESSPEVRLRTLFFSLRISFPKIHLFFYVAIVLVLPGVWRTAVISPSFFLFVFVAWVACFLESTNIYINVTRSDAVAVKPFVCLCVCVGSASRLPLCGSVRERGGPAECWSLGSLAAGQPYCFEQEHKKKAEEYSLSFSPSYSYPYPIHRCAIGSNGEAVLQCLYRMRFNVSVTHIYSLSPLSFSLLYSLVLLAQHFTARRPGPLLDMRCHSAAFVDFSERTAAAALPYAILRVHLVDCGFLILISFFEELEDILEPFLYFFAALFSFIPNCCFNRLGSESDATPVRRAGLLLYLAIAIVEESDTSL